MHSGMFYSKDGELCAEYKGRGCKTISYKLHEGAQSTKTYLDKEPRQPYVDITTHNFQKGKTEKEI